MPKSARSSPKILLGDTQLIALSNAAQREDGAIAVSDHVKGAAVQKFIATLIEKGLARETRAKPGMPVARRDEERGAFALVITKSGRAVINVDDDEDGRAALAKSSKGDGEKKSRSAKRLPTVGSDKSRKTSKAPPTAPLERSSSAATGAPREGSKLGAVIGLLSRASGATLDELIDATNWLPHTTRAALTGLRKRGFVLDRTRADSVTTYHILSAPEPG
jgi:hypothetical protein